MQNCKSTAHRVRRDAYLGVITRGDRNNPWSIMVSINDKPVDFEIDTGAEVTVISSKAHHEIGGPTLCAASKTLRGPSNSELPVKGQFTAMLKYKNKVIEQDLYVVESLHKHLLGHPAIEALNIVTRVLTIEGSGPVEQYPQLFVGLGKLEGEYSIRLEEGAKPYALSVPRRVAIPLMKPVKEELRRMEKLGVTTRVTEPTRWCAAMVVVPKEV